MASTYRQAQHGAGPSQAGRNHQRVLRRGTALVGLATAAVLAAACGSSGGSTASRAASGKAGPNAVVSARQLSGIGTALVTSSGMTIYTPKTPAEMNGTIKCTGSCLSFWFPVTASPANPASSDLPGKLGTIRRPEGTTQLTYNGRPLYTFRLDTSPGQAHGNNFTDSFNGVTFHWQIVTTSGKPGGASSATSSGHSYQAGY